MKKYEYVEIEYAAKGDFFLCTNKHTLPHISRLISNVTLLIFIFRHKLTTLTFSALTNLPYIPYYVYRNLHIQYS